MVGLLFGQMDQNWNRYPLPPASIISGEWVSGSEQWAVGGLVEVSGLGDLGHGAGK